MQIARKVSLFSFDLNFDSDLLAWKDWVVWTNGGYIGQDIAFMDNEEEADLDKLGPSQADDDNGSVG